jgi:nuclear transport factor 2 (NTF2) superfamily protein
MPPFTLETARAKVKAAENAWNRRDPEIVAQGYTEDSDWRPNGILQGPQGVQGLPEAETGKGTGLPPDEGALVLCRKSNLRALRDEWHDSNGQWYRTHGNEHWEFDDEGLMRRRDMSANDHPIQESERRYGR